MTSAQAALWLVTSLQPGCLVLAHSSAEKDPTQGNKYHTEEQGGTGGQT